jgi:protein O-mannosyl-transferase
MHLRVRRFFKPSALLLLFLLGTIAYANALSNGFHFDDYEGIIQNASLRDLRNIPSYFSDPIIFRLTNKLDWRPILQVTYAIDYAIGGLNPIVFHATDALLHVIAAWMIFLIVDEIVKQVPHLFGDFVGRDWLALAPAIVFVVHTVNTQTVDYVWARSSLLSALFYLVAFYCCLRGPFNQQGRAGASWHVAALGSFALALGSKATAVSLPGMLLTYEALMLNPAGKNPLTLYLKEPRRLIKYLPTLAVLLAYMALRARLTPHVMGRFVADSWISRKTYLLTQFRAWMYYIKLYLWPDPLIFDFPGFGWSTSLSDIRVIAALAMVILIVAAAWRLRNSHPLPAFFTFWFFIALLPEASLIVRPDAVTGHRPYLAYAGLSVAATLFAAKGVQALWRRWKPMGGGDERFRRLCVVFLILVALALIGATMRRNRDWRDEVTLWSDVVKKDPTNARAYMSLGAEYLDRNEYAKAREALDKAIEISPNGSEVYLYRANLNQLLGNYEEALADLAKTVGRNRPSAFSFVYRGDVYRDMGHYDDALRDYESALKLNPTFAEAHYGAAMAHWKKDELTAAAESCKKLLELEPDNRRSYQCLGSLLMHQQLFAQALKIYYAGVSRFPENGTLWYGLGTAYEELGRYKEAQDAYAKSSALQETVSENTK